MPLNSVQNNMSQGSNLGYQQSYGYNFGDSSATGSNNAQSTSQSGQDPGLASFVKGTYQDSLAQHSKIYQDVNSGYLNALNGVNAQAGNINDRYGQLNDQVQNRIDGSFAGQRQAIEDQYAQARGAGRVSNVARGLGSSTVQNSTDRGLLFDKMKAQQALAGQEAQLGAGYQSSLGSAGINAYSQAMGIGGQLGGQHMSVLGSQNFSPMGWAPNTSTSQSTAQGQNQSQSHNQGENWSYGVNMGQNSSQGYGYTMNPNRAQPTMYYPPMDNGTISGPWTPGSTTGPNGGPASAVGQGMNSGAIDGGWQDVLASDPSQWSNNNVPSGYNQNGSYYYDPTMNGNAQTGFQTLPNGQVVNIGQPTPTYTTSR